jgi:hypothetical protein
MNRHPLRRFPYTFSALALAVIVVVVALIWDLSAFDLPGVDIIGIEANETDAIVITCLLVIPAFFIDRSVTRQRAHEAQLQAEQLRVLRVTMRTVQDIVNNNLNQLQLLRVQAEDRVPDETLTLFDETIQNTASRLTALANLDVFSEHPMTIGPSIYVRAPSGRA